ncbi:MAG: MogA/MoaB family molybdenum cofactor biosynthesis protein, partial [Syntrophobacteraceae bacterium]
GGKTKGGRQRGEDKGGKFLAKREAGLNILAGFAINFLIHWGKKLYSRKTAIVTMSDLGSQGKRVDLSGQVLAERLGAEAYEVFFRTIIPDDCERIKEVLVELADRKGAALIVTTGGTGVSPRDVTPEATLAVIEKSVPGMAEAMRAASMRKTAHAMLSRAVAGIRGKTLILNLPGSPGGALENLEAVLPALSHALDKIQGDPSDCAAK